MHEQSKPSPFDEGDIEEWGKVFDEKAEAGGFELFTEGRVAGEKTKVKTETSTQSREAKIFSGPDADAAIKAVYDKHLFKDLYGKLALDVILPQGKDYPLLPKGEQERIEAIMKSSNKGWLDREIVGKIVGRVIDWQEVDSREKMIDVISAFSRADEETAKDIAAPYMLLDLAKRYELKAVKHASPNPDLEKELWRRSEAALNRIRMEASS